MKKLVIGLVIATLKLSSTSFAESDSAKPIICITKIAPHPSLDAIEKGIMDELADQKIDGDIRTENAQGNIATATQIAKKFVSLSPKIIIPITTPSAQTVYKPALEKKIPVVFAAVSDPVSAKLVDKKSMLGKGITGVSDVSPIDQQVGLIKKFQPTIKKVGVLYNPGESNSLALLDQFKKQAAKVGIDVIESPCPNTNEVSTGTRQLLGKVEAIYIPNDNTVVSALESVLTVTGEKLPVYAADPDSVKRGCVASAALSQYQIGREAGKVAARVLSGESPDTIQVVVPTQVEVAVNAVTAKNLGLSIPSDISEKSIIKGE